MAAPIFKDDVICLSGTFPGYKHNDLKNVVKNSGGAFSQRMVATCTHLVTTQDDVDAGSTKCKSAAAFQNIKLVNVDWILDSSNGKKRVDETTYLITPSGASTAAAPASPSTPPPAQTRPSRNKRTLDSQANGTTASDAKDGPPAKKQKDDSGKSLAKDKQSTPDKKDVKIKVPVDDPALEAAGYQVYIDDDGVIWDAAMNQTNASYNNNKFYLLQLLVKNSTKTPQFLTFARWGRVGEVGQSSQLAKGASLDAATKAFMKKFRDKSGLPWEKRMDNPKASKYAFVERNYEEDDDEPEKTPMKKKGKKESGEVKAEEDEEPPVESTLSKPVQDLVGLIFNQQHWQSTMASMEYDANKLPLGKLGRNTLNAGFQLLKDLSEVVNDHSLASSKYGSSFNHVVEDLSNRYLSTIPHAFGRRRPPVINTQPLIKREVDLLEALTDMEIANEIMTDAEESAEKDRVHRLDQQYNGLNMKEMIPLDHKSTEFGELEKYLVNSRGKTHNLKYKLLDVFRIERQGETDRFLNSSYANVKNSNRRLLWHGSRTTNYGGILSQGLRIAPPEAPVSGYMFGKGVYFADISSKSANYCRPGLSNNMALLMLCDVELGDPMLELKQADYMAGEKAKKEGKLATWGLGSTGPVGWKDAECLHPDLKGVLMPQTSTPPQDSGSYNSLLYNEYIAYDVAQIRIKYLLLVHMP